MMLCTGVCIYFHTFKNFARSRTYDTHKKCTTCNHVVDKEEFPDINCYCCAARYRARYPKSKETRKTARERKKANKNLDLLNPIMVNTVK